MKRLYLIVVLLLLIASVQQSWATYIYSFETYINGSHSTGASFSFYSSDFLGADTFIPADDLFDVNALAFASQASVIGVDILGPMTGTPRTLTHMDTNNDGLSNADDLPDLVGIIWSEPFNHTGTYGDLAYPPIYTLTISEVGAPVPEPTTMLLLGTGLLGLMGYGRKRFKKS